MQILTLLLTLGIASASFRAGILRSSMALTSEETQQVGVECEDKDLMAMICAALSECKDACKDPGCMQAGITNWGAKRCNSVDEGPCRDYCTNRVLQLNDLVNEAPACPACTKTDFTPEGDCEGYLEKVEKMMQAGTDSPVYMIKRQRYCQIKVANPPLLPPPTSSSSASSSASSSSSSSSPPPMPPQQRLR